MIGLEDRQSLAQDIGTAHAAGARLQLACEIAGIDVRTLQRWKAHEGLTAGDGRPQAVRPLPSHALSRAERAAARCAWPTSRASRPCRRRASCPCWPTTACTWPASPPSAACCATQGQAAHRGRAKEPRAVRPPTTHVATAPRQVWCWDISAP